MRRGLVLLLVAACGSHKPVLPGAAADSLWDLAPDRTSLALVITPAGVATIAHALPVVRTLFATGDLAEWKPEVDHVLELVLGKADAGFADSGLTTERGLATFVTSDGHAITIFPVADRDRWLALRDGAKGGTGQDDRFGGRRCRELRGVYACTDDATLFDRLGKGALHGKLAALGDRGDIEVYGADVVPFESEKGELVAIARLGDGTIEVRGRWSGKPDGLAGRLAGAVAPNVEADGAAGFARIQLAPLLADASPTPIAAGVTALEFAKSLRGPVRVVVPSGTVDLRIDAPLADPAPATTLVQHCDEIPLPHGQSQTPGACRLAVQLATPLELDAWVEHGELRVASHKDAPAAGKPGALTEVGRELATGEWSAAFWGRGTLLDASHVTPATGPVPVEAARSIHLMSLVDELGAAIAFERDGFRFRLYARTVYANPPDVAAKLAAIDGEDVARGRSTDQARAIAAAAPKAPIAADLEAGQGGLVIPAAVGGTLAAIAVPRIAAWLAPGAASGSASDGDPSSPPPGIPDKPMDQAELTKLLVTIYAQEAIPAWQADHKGKTCPASVDELASYLHGDPGVPTKVDPWGHALFVHCDAHGIEVRSAGPDGKPDTADDIRP